MKELAFVLPLLAVAMPAVATHYAPHYLPLALLGTGLAAGCLAALAVKLAENIHRRPISITIVNDGSQLKISDGRSTVIVDPGKRVHVLDGHIRRIEQTRTTRGTV